MVTYTAPDRTWDAGVPKQSADDFGVTPEGLIVGDIPAQFVQDKPVGLSQTLKQYTVVGFAGNVPEGDIVPASATVKAIGILMYPVTSAASGAKPVGRVLRAAVINPLFAGLVWDASFNTRDKKMNAFEGAPSPTAFVTRPLAHFTPTLP